MSDTKPPSPPRAGLPPEAVDTELGDQLKRIETEETPEELLKLARQLQDLLRGRS